MFFTIVVPTLNEAKYLPRLTASLKPQTFRDYELIVVDGFSKDDTAAISRAAGARVIQEKSRVSAARNRGAAEGSGRYVVFMDADIILPDPEYLKDLAQILDEFRIIHATTSFQPYDEDKWPEWAPYPTDFHLGLWWNHVTNFHDATLLHAVDRQRFIEVGGFRDDVNILEHVDLFRRLPAVFLPPRFQVWTTDRRQRQYTWTDLFLETCKAHWQLFIGQGVDGGNYWKGREAGI